LIESFDPVHKAQRRKEVFPQDCQKAYELGARLAEKRNECNVKKECLYAIRSGSHFDQELK